jgi:hypothetical protein
MDKEMIDSMRRIRRNWTEDLISETQTATCNGHMRTVYRITRVLSNERIATTAVKDKQGKHDWKTQ